MATAAVGSSGNSVARRVADCDRISALFRRRSRAGNLPASDLRSLHLYRHLLPGCAASLVGAGPARLAMVIPDRGRYGDRDVATEAQPGSYAVVQDFSRRIPARLHRMALDPEPVGY